MPIGATIGAAAIGVGGSMLASSKQSKATKAAANITTQDNAANRALQTDIYNRNVGFLSPWMQTGQTANNALMELLGFPQQQPQPSAFGGYGTPGMPANGYNGGSAFGGGQPYMAAYSENWSPDGAYHEGAPAYGPQPTTGVTTAAPNARSAFDTYRGSTGYDFRFNEGMRGLQSAFSRNLESGAASKAAIRYGQGVASDEFGRYTDMLRGQSQLGFGAGSALAGVGQQFGNTVTAGNQSAASAAANARLYAGNAAAQNWASMGSSFGNALGMIKW